MTPLQLRQQINRKTTLVGVGAIIFLIAVGALFFHLVEGHSWFDSFYFVIMTMTTVGYGDIVPTSIIGKSLTMLYAITGVPLFIFIAGFVVEHRLTGLVTAYVKHHTTQMFRLETQVDEITDDVEQINENIEQISDDVEQINENIEQITEQESFIKGSLKK